MSTSSETSPKHDLLWGVWLGLAIVAAIQILTWVGLGLSNLTWISTWVLVAIFAVLGAKSLARRQGDRPKFLRVATMLVVMLLVSSLIYQTYMWVYINYIDPTWVDTVAEVWAAQLEEGGASADEIEKNITRFRKQWETKFVFTTGIVAYSLPPFLLGLLSATLLVVQPWKKRSVA